MSELASGDSNGALAVTPSPNPDLKHHLRKTGRRAQAVIVSIAAVGTVIGGFLGYWNLWKVYRSEVPHDGQIVVAQPPWDRVRAMAASKSIPLPDKLAINTNTRGIPTNFAKYLGAWELVRGWGEGKGRDGLLIVMTVDDKGHAAGLYAAGPPKKEELTRNPEFYRRVEGVISDEGFTAQAGTWQYKFVLAGDDVLFGRGEGPGVGGTVQARGHLRRIQ